MFNANPSGWQSATTALLLGEAARLEEVDDPTTVSEEQLAPLVDEAIRRWAETGVDSEAIITPIRMAVPIGAGETS